MKWDDLYIQGLGGYLPARRVLAADMVESGRFSETEAQKTRHRAAAVSTPGLGETAPQMAMTAARLAIAEAGCRPESIATLIHAVVLHNGLEAWNCGSYLQRELGITDCVPIEIRTACAGGIVGMQLVGTQFAARTCRDDALGLVTAADAWKRPLFDRWASDSGLVYGDGAGAVVLGRGSGRFRVRSSAVASDPLLELMHRGNEPMSAGQYTATGPIDLKARVATYLESHLIDEFWTRNDAALRRCAGTALTDAGASQDEIRRWIVPNFGAVLVRKQVLEPLGIDYKHTLWEHGRDIGHTGAADPFLGLELLRNLGDLHAGDLVMLVGIGVGFTWGCAVVEYLDDGPHIHEGSAA